VSRVSAASSPYNHAFFLQGHLLRAPATCRQIGAGGFLSPLHFSLHMLHLKPSSHPANFSFKWKGGSISNSTPRSSSSTPINCTFQIISDIEQVPAASLLSCADANLWTPPPPLDLVPIVAPAILAPTALAALVYIVRRVAEWRRKSQHQRRAAFSQVSKILLCDMLLMWHLTLLFSGDSQACARSVSLRQRRIFAATGPSLAPVFHLLPRASCNTPCTSEFCSGCIAVGT
jgi:hypothetical protein